jgi:hypothetical protein
MPESESFEEKSSFEWGREGQHFDLLKTIVAFANCAGGQILLKQVSGDHRRLDSARIDDFANTYVSPRLQVVNWKSCPPSLQMEKLRMAQALK